MPWAISQPENKYWTHVNPILTSRLQLQRKFSISIPRNFNFVHHSRSRIQLRVFPILDVPRRDISASTKWVMSHCLLLLFVLINHHFLQLHQSGGGRGVEHPEIQPGSEALVVGVQRRSEGGRTGGQA